MLTSLSEEKFKVIRDNPEDYYVVKGNKGLDIERLGVDEDWGITDSPLRFLDDKFGILRKIEDFYSQQEDKIRPVVIFDWGAGDGTSLVHCQISS